MGWVNLWKCLGYPANVLVVGKWQTIEIMVTQGWILKKKVEIYVWSTRLGHLWLPHWKLKKPFSTFKTDPKAFKGFC